MILQVLTDYYHALSARGEIARDGWGPAKVSFALVLDESGALVDVMPLKEEVERGKKKVEISRVMEVPKQVVRTVGIKANFLCDNAGYLLGVDAKGKRERALRCFAACKELHLNLLQGVESGAAQAVCAYFESWNPDAAQEHPALQAYWDEILSGGNLVFRFAGGFVQEDPAVAEAWDSAAGQEEDAIWGRCLVTGRQDWIIPVHGKIKGVQGAQSGGASLVSFNASAFESYEKKQSFNAPVGEKAAFAYTTALNHLLADREHVRRIGDATVVYWSKTAEPSYQWLFGQSFDPIGPESGFDENELKRAIEHLANGESYEIDGDTLRPETPFYILGLSPNAARLSVRFFYTKTFGKFMENIKEHEKRLELVKPAYEPSDRLPLFRLVQETVNPNARDKSASPLLAGALMRAVINDGPYPAALENGVLLRIRAEHKVSWAKASILKAVLMKKEELCQEIKEVLIMHLNDESNYQPYVLGRLFSVLEDIQQTANPGINTTIRDRYFNSAAATPASIFPVLTRLSNAHLGKIKGLNMGAYVRLSQAMQKLSDKIRTELPARHCLSDQEIFFLGYYHETQKRYEKKEKKED